MNVNLMMRLLPQVLFAVLWVVISIGITFTAFAEEIPLNFNSPEYHPNDGYWQIEKPGDYYLAFELDTFYTNTYSAIRIYCDDVTLDGRGKTITGSGPPSEDKGPNRCGVQVTWAYQGSDNVHIRNLKVEKKYHGILFESIYNGTVENCTTTGNNHGITLWNAEWTTLKGNTSNKNNNGIVLDGNQCVNENNTIINNTANNNQLVGIILHLVNRNNELIGNTANENGHFGISLPGNSDSNILSGNTTDRNVSTGIHIQNSDSNEIKGNTIGNNGERGIWLLYANNNVIHNNYFENGENVRFDGTCTGNQWNTSKKAGTNIVGGPYLGGNFWATPDGDGFSQTTPDNNGDGFCDSAYTFSGNVDQLPLHGYTVTITPPTVTTSSVSAITCDAVSSGGNVTSSGGASVTARGVCWSTSENPTVNDWHTTDGTGTGAFQSTITGLNLGTAYHVRAYATNSAGTGYGADLPFATQPFEGIVYVSPNDQTCGANCPCYPTIQDAIDAPYDAHTIKIFEGNYAEGFTLNESRTILVEGETANTSIKSPTVQKGSVTFRNLTIVP